MQAQNINIGIIQAGVAAILTTLVELFRSDISFFGIVGAWLIITALVLAATVNILLGLGIVRFEP